MSNVSDIKVDYYINKISSKEIVKKYALSRSRINASMEKIYEEWAPYVHPTLDCEHCGQSLISHYLNRNTKESKAEIEPVLTELVPQQLGLNRNDGVLAGGSWDSRVSGALLVQQGFKVSIPLCKTCGHSPIDSCLCAFCQDTLTRNKESVVNEVMNRYSAGGILPLSLLGCREILELLYGFIEATENQLVRNFLVREEELGLAQKNILKNLGLLAPTKQSVHDSVRMTSVYKYVFDSNRLVFASVGDGTLQDSLDHLKELAVCAVSNPRNSWVLIDIWEGLALKESLNVAKKYCDMQNIAFLPDPKLVSLIQKSLYRFGLAQTARYICNSVRRAKLLSSEDGKPGEVIGYICRNLSFWIDDERAQAYEATPFVRGPVLEEPLKVRVFANHFLEPNGIDYFSSPIIQRNLTFKLPGKGGVI